jgi:hypothetical protein
MTFDPTLLPIIMVSVGLGLFVAGIGRTIIRSRSPRFSAAIFGVAAFAAMGVALLGSIAAAGIVALVILATVAMGLLANLARVERIGSIVARFRKSHVLRWSAVGLLGIGLAALGSAGLDRAVDAIVFEDRAHMEELMAMPTLEAQPVGYARTDCGSEIPLLIAADERDPKQLRSVEQHILTDQGRMDLVIRRRPPADRCNCHGWVFAGGEYWVGLDQVEHILDDNGYLPISEPRPGDLAIYRNSADTIIHSAVVRATCDDGIVLVEGKWGWMGVFLHPVGESYYGKNYTFYRSDRAGHLLVDLPASKPLVPMSTRTD